MTVKLTMKTPVKMPVKKAVMRLACFTNLATQTARKWNRKACNR